MVDFSQIDAVLASGHRDDEHVALPLSLLRVLADEARSAATLRARMRHERAIVGVCEQLKA